MEGAGRRMRKVENDAGEALRALRSAPLPARLPPQPLSVRVLPARRGAARRAGAGGAGRPATGRGRSVQHRRRFHNGNRRCFFSRAARQRQLERRYPHRRARPGRCDWRARRRHRPRAPVHGVLPGGEDHHAAASGDRRLHADGAQSVPGPVVVPRGRARSFDRVAGNAPRARAGRGKFAPHRAGGSVQRGDARRRPGGPSPRGTTRPVVAARPHAGECPPRRGRGPGAAPRIQLSRRGRPRAHRPAPPRFADRQGRIRVDDPGEQRLGQGSGGERRCRHLPRTGRRQGQDEHGAGRPPGTGRGKLRLGELAAAALRGSREPAPVDFPRARRGAAVPGDRRAAARGNARFRVRA